MRTILTLSPDLVKQLKDGSVEVDYSPELLKLILNSKNFWCLIREPKKGILIYRKDTVSIMSVLEESESLV